jgi:histidinol-phosphatase (PHP family)
MRYPPDYHMHTPLCRHATGEPVELAARAVQAGLDEIGFSDHNPMPVDNYDEWRMNLDQLGAYVEAVDRARKASPQLSIKLALEVDYLPEYENWVRELRAMHPWDYFIGSVHYVDKWAIDNPYDLSEWDRRDTYEIWAAYFERLTKAAASGLFEIIGHADLCKKFARYPQRDCSELYGGFLAAAAGSGTAIELNTAGLRKDCREIYPSLKLLTMARQARVSITFGSDAHAPEEVGADFEAAVKLARQAGYTHSLRFTARRRETVALPH